MTHHQLTLTEIKRIFEDFLIVTAIKQYNPNSAIHTALLYEYVAARVETLGYPLSQYIAIMRRINMYAVNVGREGDGGE